MKYAEILFQQKVGQDQETLTYEVPEGSKIEPGQAVEVPIRKRASYGIVWKIHDNKPDFKTFKIKKINEKLLSKEQLQLIEWISTYYFCPLHKVLKLFIPRRILQNKDIRSREKRAKKIEKSVVKNLTTAQKEIVDSISKSRKNSFLIHGITGSGKTEIYSRLAENYIKKNQQVLILVPEISLTPQMIEYFEKSLGIEAAVIHSKLSEGEKFHAWKKIHNNEAKLIIGSRSSVFTPMHNLALVIVDEEHEFSYKQDQSPRYNLKSILKKMQEISPQIKAVYGSATPSVESFENMKNRTHFLKERIGNAVLPEIEIVDLREEFKKKNYSIFSDSLSDSLNKILEQKMQAILFLNRRGSASSVVCRDCGHRVLCEECEIPMTYHSHTLKDPTLICHHCGKISQPPNVCPECQGPNIRFLGIGTQRIESEIKKHFPSARVLRADKDTTGQKHGFKNIYQSFKNHEADILIGTQMIAKGLDLPKVALVGVVLADIGLNIPDFRSNERNFQLLTQVAGRAGRADHPGKVIIQTYNPDSISLTCSQQHNFDEFFKYEITQRKLLKNPPFSKLCKITIQNSSAKSLKTLSEELEKHLWQIAREQDFAPNLEINLYPAYINKIRGKFQNIILIKDLSNSNIIHKILGKMPKKYIMDTNLKIDIDPLITS